MDGGVQGEICISNSVMVVLVSFEGVHVLDVKLSGLGHIPSPEQQYSTGHSA